MSACSQISDNEIASYEILGCRIHPIASRELTAFVAEQVEKRKSCVIANHNLHSLHLVHRDPLLKRFFSEAEVVHIDGMGIVGLGRVLGIPLLRSHRVTYVDWLPVLMSEASERGWRVFYLGSKPGVAHRGAQILRNSFPDLTVETAHGYFALEGPENEAVLDRISSFAPDLLLVGMGMPRQEHWIHKNRARLGSAVLLCSGAAIDYFAGEVPTPPRWAGRVGLEWAFRLLAEPGRLWKRYLVEPWYVLRLTALHWVRTNFSEE